eukprot:gene8588-11603_t
MCYLCGLCGSYCGQSSQVIIPIAIGAIVGVIALLSSKTSKKSYARKLINIVFTLILLLVLVLFGYLSVLMIFPEINLKIYAHILAAISKDASPMDSYRCKYIQNVKGRVLEIGPGPGNNFRCWENNNQITEWVGIEPNQYFEQYLQESRRVNNIHFNMTTLWINGENSEESILNLELEPSSFDAVIATHVLCSVNNISAVLDTIELSLKPNGIYYFLEHVTAPVGTNMLYLQEFVSPLFSAILNGCTFKPLWNNIESLSTRSPSFNVSLQHFEAPLPLSVIVPHVYGIAVKK